MNLHRIYTALLAGALLLSLTACGDSSGDDGGGATNNGAATNNDVANNDVANNDNGIPDRQDTDGPWSWLLIDDLTPTAMSTDEPGADLDAIGLYVGGEGEPLYVREVEEHQVQTTSNDHADPQELLGPPDAECEDRRYVSVGGSADINYLIVGFGDFDSERQIDSGDTIEFWELGPDSCPDADFEEEAVELQLSMSTTMDTWITLGTWSGGEPVVVP